MRRRTALSVVSAAIGGAVVPLSFASAPASAAAAEEQRGPQRPSARWDFDERAGTVTREAVSGTADPVDYVFNDARYKPDSDPVRRRGVGGRALYFDGYSTVVTAPGPRQARPRRRHHPRRVDRPLRLRARNRRQAPGADQPA
ncbi:hypothetical protein ACFWWT_46920 [Streptomyces sp. NPDC058676]|uniref:hypothetical protein n=1 Tax=unclassified Streptomyces TaxID=2593676 RepID=UPI0036644C96